LPGEIGFATGYNESAFEGSVFERKRYHALLVSVENPIHDSNSTRNESEENISKLATKIIYDEKTQSQERQVEGCGCFTAAEEGKQRRR
jgi:hypothetical protein